MSRLPASQRYGGHVDLWKLEPTRLGRIIEIPSPLAVNP
jgi:hypothetical protein